VVPLWTEPISSKANGISHASSSRDPSLSQHSSTTGFVTPPSGPTEVESLLSEKTQNNCRVVFLSEQILHHPPVSAFYGECQEKGLVISGNDQLSAHFTGTCNPI
jgi:oxysterol-binding protein-related protein 9/10/11